MSLIDIKEVMRLTTLSRVSLWRLERRGLFPKRIRISRNRIAWFRDEVEAWIAARAANRNEIPA
jgi:prophage regulatory protein